MSLWIKICGIRRVDDALAAADAGADAIGLNFWRNGKRFVDPGAARAIADAVRGRVQIVGVFVDASAGEIEAVDAAVGLDLFQLHGDEPPELPARWPGRAYKAVRVRRAEDLERLARYGGPFYLVDAWAANAPGGTGRRVDARWAREARRYGRIVLAGGLTPDNVAEAVRQIEPWGVDVASGVERAPGVKDAARISAFVKAARGAATAGG